jgi:hypothetical protein
MTIHWSYRTVPELDYVDGDAEKRIVWQHAYRISLRSWRSGVVYLGWLSVAASLCFLMPYVATPLWLQVVAIAVLAGSATLMWLLYVTSLTRQLLRE